MASTQLDNAHSNVIITGRFSHRPLAASDADAVYALRSDPKVFYWKIPEDRLQSDQWLDARLASPKSHVYIVELPPSTSANSANTPKIIGLAGRHTPPGIGYMFTPSSWGYGYATEALQAWMEWYWRK